MKILIVISHLYMGGFSKSLINFLLCAQQDPTVELSLLMLENIETELDKDIPENVTVIRLKDLTYMKHHSSNGALFFRHYKYSFKEFFCRKFLNHSASSLALNEYVQAKLSNRSKRLAVDFSFAKEYDAVISWEEGFCNYVLVDQIPAKYKIGFIHPNYRESHFSKVIDKPYIDKLDRIVAISESCYQTLCDEFPFAKDKIVYAPNRLNFAQLAANAEKYSCDIDDKQLNLLTVARIDNPHKAIFRIADLCEKLKENGFSFRWHLVGDGLDFPKLKEIITNKQLEDVLICWGEKSNPCPYMKQADLFVMQSNWEGRPVAVDEALLLGTPALITNYSSAHEQIEDGKTGWIVENSFDAIYEKLEEILRNPVMLKDVAKHVSQLDHHAYEDCSALLSLIPKQP